MHMVDGHDLSLVIVKLYFIVLVHLSEAAVDFVVKPINISGYRSSTVVYNFLLPISLILCISINQFLPKFFMWNTIKGFTENK